ncbi:hypothetical protein [Chitinimonas taiwanensis]|jgi:TRAP-type C4-dicarboxylate transport system permease small subunit|uniref:DUF3185 domain-containing protein n=1 Tax=Chitinimonas taiwanensis DSM 18899 TaxID=1121279 RepID=A0A1K2H9N8_9NEIS|nr:hypothetical protein [Chitinimonas taiwanensis]SFZ73512.1 hypothetical protein SAMN02745887_00866 [Chitinimonas taiwanensis DSM 18899]
MNLLRIVAIALILAGALGLGMGGFSYTTENQAAKLGPLELTVKEEKQVPIPAWLSGGAIALGVVLLLMGNRKR